MNERIRQLAEQARQYAWENETHWSAGPERERLFEQKFAEMIVAECVSVVDKTLPPGYADYPDYRDQIEQAFRRECTTEIKKHFRVTE